MRYVEGTDLGALVARGRRARTRAGDRDRPAGRRGARRRARAGPGAPGRQAGQRPARAAARFGGGGARLPLGLRADEALGERLRHHRDGAVRRDARLRGARAVQGRYAGRADRRLLARVRAVRVPDRPASVHVRERRRPDVRAPAGAAAGGHRGSTRAADGDRRCRHEGHVQGTGGSAGQRWWTRRRGRTSAGRRKLAANPKAPEPNPPATLVPVLAVAVALVLGIVVSSLLRNDTSEETSTPPQTTPQASASPTVPPTFRTVERALSEDRGATARRTSRRT